MTRYYKFLTKDGHSPFQHTPWHLPTKQEDGTWTPGEWMPTIEAELSYCRRGYHAVRADAGFFNYQAERLFVLEYDGEVHDASDKSLGHKARLVREVEGWTAERVLRFCLDELKLLIEMTTVRSAPARKLLAWAVRDVESTLAGDKPLYWRCERRCTDLKRISARNIKHRQSRDLLHAARNLVWMLGYMDHVPGAGSFLGSAACVRDVSAKAMRDAFFAHIGLEVDAA
jgi:hypothetical protein